METHRQHVELWEGVTGASDEGKAVRTLVEILLDKEGRTFISNLAHKDAELCIEILDLVSPDPCFCFPLSPSQVSRQGLAKHNLKVTEKQAFLIALIRLTGIHGRLPGSMMITEEIKVSDKILASGGFADVRTGTYTGHLVAVKNLRVRDGDDFLKMRKVSANDIFSAAWNVVLTILPSDFVKKLSSGIRYPI